MASSPVHSASHRGVFNYTRVVMNTSLISAPVPAPLNENLLNREVFDYDFSRERVFLEIAHAELEAMKEAEQKASVATSGSTARASMGSEAGRGSSESGKDFDDDLARHVGASLSVSGSGRSLTSSRARTTSDDDVAAAISASLREY
ncbi:hypothetical protein PINS_up013264 [Pythium insidiosum]|nr:hypothetical protein PINS_up013264 [Pythium insidiosum]